jgi:deoxyadenosine/deoxycytidine kinase
VSDTAPFLVVAGNIATGKSSLLDALGEAFDLSTFPERWRDNPWFGVQPNQALAAQLWFLISAAAETAVIVQGFGGIQERCIDEHALVFASETLRGADAQLLKATYSVFAGLLPSPDLLVFLQASPQELERRVRQRRRPQETNLTLDRLTRLDTSYRTFIETWTRCPVVRVDTERLDLRVADDLREIVTSIERSMR